MHLHAVRSDPAHRGEAGRSTADAGGDAALPVDSDRRAFRHRIHQIFRTLAVADAGTARIVGEIVDAYLRVWKVLVLTERTEHLAAIGAALSGLVQNLVTQGRSSNKQRAAVLATLEALAPDAPRVFLSTGKWVGEGFDHPPLDTLILVMPISWKGALRQPAQLATPKWPFSPALGHPSETP